VFGRFVHIRVFVFSYSWTVFTIPNGFVIFAGARTRAYFEGAFSTSSVQYHHLSRSDLCLFSSQIPLPSPPNVAILSQCKLEAVPGETHLRVHVLASILGHVQHCKVRAEVRMQMPALSRVC
jgi:hypothetical protein